MPLATLEGILREYCLMHLRSGDVPLAYEVDFREDGDGRWTGSCQHLPGKPKDLAMYWANKFENVLKKQEPPPHLWRVMIVLDHVEIFSGQVSDLAEEYRNSGHCPTMEEALDEVRRTIENPDGIPDSDVPRLIVPDLLTKHCPRGQWYDYDSFYPIYVDWEMLSALLYDPASYSTNRKQPDWPDIRQIIQSYEADFNNTILRDIPGSKEFRAENLCVSAIREQDAPFLYFTSHFHDDHKHPGSRLILSPLHQPVAGCPSDLAKRYAYEITHSLRTPDAEVRSGSVIGISVPPGNRKNDRGGSPVFRGELGELYRQYIADREAIDTRLAKSEEALKGVDVMHMSWQERLDWMKKNAAVDLSKYEDQKPDS